MGLVIIEIVIVVTIVYDIIKGIKNRVDSGKFNQIEYQNKYIKEKYDRVGLTMPKGKKEIIKARALEEGMSINEYINALIDKDIQSRQ